MEILSVKDLTFTYPGDAEPTLKNILFSAAKGEMITLCGKSGSGKTTLMRCLKPALAPHGTKSGIIEYLGDDEETGIGFVMQNPENQLVTDKVWHELTFGLENMGWSAERIRIRTAEMAGYFGIQNWFRKEVDQLSGGQKQLLNLAAVMIMQPKVLLLDEPVSQLDPAAAEKFLDTVRKLNREMGVTVIITEHRLDRVLPYSDRMIVMEDGKILLDEEPAKGAMELAREKNDMFRSMPAAVQAYGIAGDADVKEIGHCPLDIRQGRKWLETLFGGKPVTKTTVTRPETFSESGEKMGLKNILFRYEKNGEDVIRDLSLTIYKGEVHAIVGGNGTGKTTALKIMGGLLRPYRGKVDFKGLKVRMLPQNPQEVFALDTVKAELLEMSGDIEEVVSLMEIEHILGSHPYDISGGEQQRVAMGKLFLTDPDVILLDEPTKGMDNAFKEKLGDIFLSLKAKRHTLIMVSHDIEFCSKYADRCSMFFDGSVTTTEEPGKFFSGNSFYTTAANKMSSEFFEDAITPDELGMLICENLKEKVK